MPDLDFIQAGVISLSVQEAVESFISCNLNGYLIKLG